MKITKNKLRNIQCLYSMFKFTHPPKRICIIISENFNIPIEKIEELLSDEIRDWAPVKVLKLIKKMGKL